MVRMNRCDSPFSDMPVWYLSDQLCWKWNAFVLFLFSSNEYCDIVARFSLLTCVKMNEDRGKSTKKRPVEMEKGEFSLESFSCRSSLWVEVQHVHEDSTCVGCDITACVLSLWIVVILEMSTSNNWKMHLQWIRHHEGWIQLCIVPISLFLAKFNLIWKPWSKIAHCPPTMCLYQRCCPPPSPLTVHLWQWHFSKLPHVLKLLLASYSQTCKKWNQWQNIWTLSFGKWSALEIEGQRWMLNWRNLLQESLGPAHINVSVTLAWGCCLDHLLHKVFSLWANTTFLIIEIQIAPVNIHLFWGRPVHLHKRQSVLYIHLHMFFFYVEKAKKKQRKKQIVVVFVTASPVVVNHRTVVFNRSPVAMFTIPA